MRSVVVVQTAYLGDQLLTTPLLRELRRTYPHARITVVTTDVGAAVFSSVGRADEVIRIDKRRIGCRGLLRLGRRLRESGCEVAIAAHRSYRSGFLVRLTRARRRIGFRGAPGSWAYTERIPRDHSVHASRRYLRLGASLGIDAESADARPEINPAAARGAAAGLLASAGVETGLPFVCLAPGSAWPTKRWLPERFGQVGAWARANGLGVVTLGSAGDEALCREVGQAGGGGLSSLAGKTDTLTLAAVLERAAALISNDSGAAHVAAAVGTPVVTVFGPTVPAMGYAARGDRVRFVEHPGLSCRPCGRHGARRCPRGHFRCMREVETDSVVTALASLVQVERGGAERA